MADAVLLRALPVSKPRELVLFRQVGSGGNSADTFAIVPAGLAIGVPAAVAAGRAAHNLLAGVLFQPSPTDPRILFGSAAAIS